MITLNIFSMEGGELFNRIQERTAFNERGKISHDISEIPRRTGDSD